MKSWIRTLQSASAASRLETGYRLGDLTIRYFRKRLKCERGSLSERAKKEKRGGEIQAHSELFYFLFFARNGDVTISD